MFETVEDYSRKKYDTGYVQPKWLARTILLTSLAAGLANVYILLFR